MKVAIVYDRVNKWGGAERVLIDLHEIWPEAVLYTSVYDAKKADWAKVFPNVVTSFLQKVPFARNHHEFFAWLTPLAFESFSFDKFDLVISVTSAEAKGIITKPHTKHLCICLTPTRYLWQDYETYLRQPGFGIINFFIKLILPWLINRLRIIDQIAAMRPDKIVAISKTVQNRIKKYYKRDSEIIYPGVDNEKFTEPKDLTVINEKFFLVISRLVPYKKIDLAVKAFNELGWFLKIAGTGVEYKTLKKLAKSNIELMGSLTEEELLRYYQSCQALIYPGEEDFGLTSLEAQSCGKPVIAYVKGGVAETIINKKTGLLFEEATVSSLVECLKNFKTRQFLASDCRYQAQKFNHQQFKKQIKECAENL